MTYKVQTPIAIIAFNRPDAVRQVLERVRAVKPDTLFLILDGPREDRPDDDEKCHQVRDVLNEIDWDCHVQRNFADQNMGCFQRVSTGLTWAFEHTEELIILEDDIVPTLSFFRFCDELLQRYKYDERIIAISGSNTDGKWKEDEYSYFFSPSGGIWGWATWRRAWQHFDPEMSKWADKRIQSLLHAQHRRIIWYYRYANFNRQFEKIRRGESTAWGYQWGFAGLIQSGLNIVSSVNLVHNVGHTADATHTGDEDSYFGRIPTYEVTFPLEHPPHVLPDIEFYNRRWTRLITGGKKRIGLVTALRVLLSYYREMRKSRQSSG